MPAQISPKQCLSIVALNVVSTLSQIGQFGLGATLLPVALESRHVSPEIIGFTSATYWLGMLVGLLVTGQLTRWLGYRTTVIAGLLISAISFILIPLIDWHWWALPSAGVGFGLGLRWIANETWLYRLSPAEARGRIVGIHETLICLASFIGPLIIVAYGATQATAFWIAAGFTILAIAPLFVATQLPAVNDFNTQAEKENEKSPGLFASIISILLATGLGAMIAGAGGWMEGSLLALLPNYGTAIGLSITDAAWLLTIMGVGAMVFQYPIGWFSDHKGVLWTAKKCALAAATIVILCLFFGENFYILAMVAFILGGVTSGFLTLGMIWATQHSTGADLTNRVRQVSIVYTTLSALGPFVAGFVVNHTGSQSLFWQMLVVVLVLLAVIFKQSLSEHTA